MLLHAIFWSDQIEKIIFYLKEKDNFKKYNKIVFAFRLFISPTFFVTQDTNTKAEVKNMKRCRIDYWD